jgi:hypothetical protein
MFWVSLVRITHLQHHIYCHLNKTEIGCKNLRKSNMLLLDSWRANKKFIGLCPTSIILQIRQQNTNKYSNKSMLSYNDISSFVIIWYISWAVKRWGSLGIVPPFLSNWEKVSGVVPDSNYEVQKVALGKNPFSLECFFFQLWMTNHCKLIQ